MCYNILIMRNGFSFLEVIIVIFIFSILLIPTTFIILNHQKNLSLQMAANEVAEVLDYARNCAKSEREKISVKFEGKNFYILKNGKISDRVYKLPEHIIIKEITSNFNPVVFLPDGMFQQRRFQYKHFQSYQVLPLQKSMGKKQRFLFLENSKQSA